MRFQQQCPFTLGSPCDIAYLVFFKSSQLSSQVFAKTASPLCSKFVLYNCSDQISDVSTRNASTSFLMALKVLFFVVNSPGKVSLENLQ